MIPIKVMSDYSLLKSLITIPKLILLLKKYNINVCGLCDDNLFGAIEFYDLCKKNDIKPLIGMNVFLDDIALSLYAKNYAGYQNLLYIQFLKEKKEDIKEYLKKIDLNNLYVLVDECYLDSYDNLLDIFGEEQMFVNVSSLSDEMAGNFKCVFAPKLDRYLDNQDKSIKLLKAIDEGISLNNVGDIQDIGKSFHYFMHNFIDTPSLKEFCDGINIEIPHNNKYIPHYDEKISDSKEYLKALAMKGLTKRLNGKVLENYVERLNYELDVIIKMGFVDYFLIVYDYVLFAKKNNILVGFGRGSAAGSLVSYSLGITNVDPIKYNLLFERFLNPERITMPDIDIDFEESRRDEVINYVKDKYGRDKVANIIAFGTLKCKLVLRSVAKSLEINSMLFDRFINLIDAKKTIKENLENQGLLNLVKNNQELQVLIRESSVLEGLKKHISTHAAGIVISSVNLSSVVPVTLSNGELLIGFTKDYLEELGLIKMDFLSITNLNIISSVLRSIKKDTNKEIDLNKMNFNDPNVLSVFNKADTVGIFQFESEGMKSFLKKLKPDSLEDIISSLALYRPGPMDNIDLYIRRKEGKEKVTYLDERLKPILEETYGIIIYQEQIMQILVSVGGYSYAEADLIRRAMSKKKKEDILKSEERFIEGAIKNGYKKEVAKAIYDLILKFASYGFNKSHSVSYAMICMQMAYLKYYYPAYFLANLLDRVIGNQMKTKEYLTMVKNYGIDVIEPSVNVSQDKYMIVNNKLVLPLTIIKGVGSEVIKEIDRARTSCGGKFKDIFNFVSNVNRTIVNKKVMETLIKARALRDFLYNESTLLNNLDVLDNYAELASSLDESLVHKPVLNKELDLSDSLKREYEQEAFGFYLNNHPSSKYQANNIVKLERLEKYFDKYINAVVIVERVKKVKTKNNTDMLFLSVSDETGVADAVVFPSDLEKMGDILVGDFLNVFGKVTKRFSDYQITINRIMKI